MPTRPRIYVEANCLIDAAKVEIKGVKSIQGLPHSRQQGIWMIQQILRAARAKDIEAFTSTISIAEALLNALILGRSHPVRESSSFLSQFYFQVDA